MTRRPTLPHKATHKFGAVRTERAGLKFDSKAEADYHDLLQVAVRAGDLVGLMRQPVFYLPGGTRYIADFLCSWGDGRVDARDVKGVETAEFKVKWREVQVAYPFMTFVMIKRHGLG
jgi:hypothetical protein